MWLQALVNENLDYEDKTRDLEAALSSARGTLAARGICPQNIPDASPQKRSSDTSVKMVIRVADTQRTVKAETRVIFLWYYVTQLLVRSM